MCCFSRDVEDVSNTRIFARGLGERQILVYSMNLVAPEDLAMILPIPVPKESPENAVSFINLEDYAEFFGDLNLGFPAIGSLSRNGDSREDAPDELAVIEVGSYEASFVPKIADFSRLDERFRLPDDVWETLPGYQDFGFAVFKLKENEEPQDVHPMAFNFPRANSSRLFFPTVHIHDGEVHERAEFDHLLYCQASGEEDLLSLPWEESIRPVGLFMNMERLEAIEGAVNLLQGDAHAYRLKVQGEEVNADIVV